MISELKQLVIFQISQNDNGFRLRSWAVLTMRGFVRVTLQGMCVTHLNALYSEDEFRHQWWDIRLIEHGVRDTLQQGLHWGHTVHDHTPAQEIVVEEQKHNSWTHLKHTPMYDHCCLCVFVFSPLRVYTMIFIMLSCWPLLIVVDIPFNIYD